MNIERMRDRVEAMSKARESRAIGFITPGGFIKTPKGWRKAPAHMLATHKQGSGAPKPTSHSAVDVGEAAPNPRAALKTAAQYLGAGAKKDDLATFVRRGTGKAAEPIKLPVPKHSLRVKKNAVPLVPYEPSEDLIHDLNRIHRTPHGSEHQVKLKLHGFKGMEQVVSAHSEGLSTGKGNRFDVLKEIGAKLNKKHAKKK